MKIQFVFGAIGRRYYYAHLDNFAPDINASDLVMTDSLNGIVGTTGNARNTPHLHLHLHLEFIAPGAGAMNSLPLQTEFKRINSEKTNDKKRRNK